MMNPNLLKSVDKEVTNWPSRKAYEVTMLASDNKTYTATVGKCEGDLAIYLKCNLKLSEKQMSKLISLIDDFGSERYEDGVENSESEI